MSDRKRLCFKGDHNILIEPLKPHFDLLTYMEQLKRYDEPGDPD